MASVKIKLNTQRITKKGYPIVYQIIHKRQKRLIYTKYYVLKSEFNDKKCIVSTRSRAVNKLNEAKIINDYLKIELKVLNSILERLEAENSDFCVDDVVRFYTMRESSLFFETYARGIIERLKLNGNNGTANAYLSTLNKIKTFFCGNQILISEIDINTVSNFVAFLKTQDIKINTINFYLRIFRAIYNSALKERILMVDKEPFKSVVIRSVKTKKKAITKELIKSISEFNLSHNVELEIVRDVFLFSFFARGMPFVDCTFLKYSNIVNDNIIYFRQKTKQKLEIKIEAPLRRIIEKYRNNGKYVLPIIDENSDKPLYTQYRNALRNHNKQLKIISLLLNSECELSTYVARHSWATIAKYQGIPLSVISEGLGHTSEKTTYTYLASLDQSVLNNANEKVILL